MADNDNNGRDVPAHYRTQAARCRAAAAMTQLTSVRDAYLDLAKHWDQLARQAAAL
jgi:hypothetical protein